VCDPTRRLSSRLRDFGGRSLARTAGGSKQEGQTNTCRETLEGLESHRGSSRSTCSHCTPATADRQPVSADVSKYAPEEKGALARADESYGARIEHQAEVDLDHAMVSQRVAVQQVQAGGVNTYVRPGCRARWCE